MISKKDLNPYESNKPGVWVFSTYLAEGLPYSIIRILSSVFFTDIGMKERYIGYLNFLGIPWNLKFLWAPFLDILGKKRTWMIAMQAMITLLIIGVSYGCFFAVRQADAGLILAISFQGPLSCWPSSQRPMTSPLTDTIWKV